MNDERVSFCPYVCRSTYRRLWAFLDSKAHMMQRSLGGACTGMTNKPRGGVGQEADTIYHLWFGPTVMLPE